MNHVSAGTPIQAADRLLNMANEALRANRRDDARDLLRRTLAADPVNVGAKFLWGLLASWEGDYETAVASLKEVVAEDPHPFEALTVLCTVHRQRGDAAAAIEAGQRASRLRPNDARSLNNLGRAYLGARRLDEAATTFRRAIELAPQFAPAYYNLGKTRQFEGQDGAATEAFAQAAALEPALDNLLAYGQSLLTLYDLPRAGEVARHAVGKFPDSVAAHLLLCGVLVEGGDREQAERHLARAIELDPDRKEALSTAGRQTPLGHLDDARQNLRLAIEREPYLVAAYESLVRITKVGEGDRPLVEQMARLSEERSLGPTERVSLHYALGKAREDLGEFGPAMADYDEANRLVRQIKIGETPFDRDAFRGRVDRMIEAFPRMKDWLDDASRSDLPVLIVGMMRSGTTLVEQILSCHPAVSAAGEQLFWPRNAGRVLSEARAPDPGTIAALGWEYVAHLSGHAENAERVTDKLPGNFMFAGLVHAALPHARLIHIRRNPLDTCLSIWATPNHAPSEGGHRKADLVFAYLEYLRMMEHWRRVLPADRLFELDYETLVREPERLAREVVAFCGLEWDEACLRPEANARAVTTLSVGQVRRPVYRSSVDRAQNFGPWLGEFAELMDVRHPALDA